MVPCLSPTSFPTSINSASQGESALNKTTIGPWSKSQEPYGSSWLCFSKKYPWLWPSKSANTHGLPQEELKRVRSRVESRQGARKKLSKPMLLFSALLARFFQNVLESSVVFVGGLLAPWLSWRAERQTGKGCTLRFFYSWDFLLLSYITQTLSWMKIFISGFWLHGICLPLQTPGLYQ